MKSEPNVYSITDLKRDGTTCWDGVRNYQARNFMRDDMRLGDGVLYYHSNAFMGIYGVAKCWEAYPVTPPSTLLTHYDPQQYVNPAWMMVDVGYVGTFGPLSR
jgi:predicted RNA-binding protein with PUA-like domain